MSFQDNKYQVIERAIPIQLAKFCFNYFLLKRNAVKHLYDNNIVSETGFFGTWKDRQVPNVYSHYADMVMETLLVYTLPILKYHTGLDLIPTYSYTRLYEKGATLLRHKDRASCEISATLTLGGDLWPIFVDPTGEDNIINKKEMLLKPTAHKGIKINLKPGDMLIYSGCELEHWREPFQGTLCHQVFLHYNDVNSKHGKSNLFDGRKMLGIQKHKND